MRSRILLASFALVAVLMAMTAHAQSEDPPQADTAQATEGGEPVPPQAAPCTTVNLCGPGFSLIGSGRVPANGLMTFAVETDGYIDPNVSVCVAEIGRAHV